MSSDPVMKAESQDKYSFFLLHNNDDYIELLSSMIFGLLSKQSVCEAVSLLPYRNIF